MNFSINGVPLSEIENTQYGHEAELFANSMLECSNGFETLEQEIETGELSIIDFEIGSEGLVWNTVKAAGSAVKGTAKAGKKTAKFLRNSFKDFKVFVKMLYDKLRKVIKELGNQLAARYTRFMKVADRYKKLGNQVREILDFLGKATGEMPDINLSWHRFDPQLLKTMFDAISNFDEYHERVIEAALIKVGRNNFPKVEDVKNAIDRNDPDKIAKYSKILSEVMGYFNENKELSIVIGLGGGDFDDIQRSALLIRMMKSIGGTVANLFTGGKFKGWVEFMRVKGSKKFRNISNDTKKQIEKEGSMGVGAGAFLKEAILGEEIRKTYGKANVDEFKADMLGKIGFLTLMSSILNNDLIFNVLKSGSLSIKKKTDLELKEIQNVIKSSITAHDKSAKGSGNANSNENSKDNNTDKKDEESKEYGSVDQMADTYIRLMGGILSRSCKDYSQIIAACLSSTFELVKETEAIVKLIQEQTTQA